MYEYSPFAVSLVIAAFLGLITGTIASNKGHSFFLWWFFGMLLFIVALPMAILLKPRYTQPVPLPSEATKQCPFCAETIKAAAIVCRFCGRDLPGSTEAPQPAGAAEEPPLTGLAKEAMDVLDSPKPNAPRRNWVGLVIIAVVAVFVVLAVLGNEPGPTRPASTSRRSETSAPNRSERRRYVYAKTAANIRSGPSTSHDIVRKTRIGEKLEYTTMAGAWYKLAEGSAGADRWIHYSVVLTQTEKERRDRCPLELVDWHWGSKYSYATAEGRVKNTSSERLEHVEAVVTFLTDSGEFITSDSALIEFDPLMPGQTSPWEVLTTWNPRMSKARVEFKELMGGKIDHYRE